MKRVYVWIALLVVGLVLPTSADNLLVGAFARLNPSGPIPPEWQPLTFPKISRHTRYDLQQDGDRTVVRASSSAAASGLIRYIHFNPARFPWLQWRWKISNILRAGDVKQKAGDDYPARIYVAFEFDSETADFWQRLRYKAACLAAGKKLPGSGLNYIWANKAPRGTVVANAFAAQVKMIVLQSGAALANQWIRERRNLVDDYELAFGRKPPQVMGIAIMTDTDNTGGQATAYYGNIELQSP